MSQAEAQRRLVGSGESGGPGLIAQSIAGALFRQGHVRAYQRSGPGTRSSSQVTREQGRFTRPARRMAAKLIIAEQSSRRCAGAVSTAPLPLRAELLSFAALEGFWKSDWLSSAVSRAAPVEPRVPLRRKRSLHAP